MRSNPYQTGIFTGLALGVLGFAIIGYSWDRVASVDCIQCQFPYLISGGLTALGLIIVGIGIIVLQVLRRDGVERDLQLERLTATVDSLTRRLSPPDEYDPELIGEFRPRPRDTANGHAPADPVGATGGWETAE